MLFRQALSNYKIRSLWFAQVLSATGDEVYRVAFVWVSVSVIGANTGYLAASQYFILLLVTLFGGKWADHWSLSKTMVRSDWIRAILVMIPVLYYYFDHGLHPGSTDPAIGVSMPLLWLISLGVMGVGGFFEPAFQALFPHFCNSTSLLKQSTGLMSTTLRLARILAPMIIGALTQWLQPIQFFVINALSFVVSAILIKQVTFEHDFMPKPAPKLGFIKILKSGFELSKQDAEVNRLLGFKAIMAGLWSLGYSLGIPMWVKSQEVSTLASFGWIIGAYGIGNFSSALFFGNLERKNPVLLCYGGFLALSIGFIGMGLSTGPWMMAFFAAFTAIGGPMNDLPAIDLMQSRYAVADRSKLFRFRIALETAGILMGFLVGPSLFHVFSAGSVLVVLGGLIGIISFWGYFGSPSRQHP
jgi:DHA3 family macrolide efflux protein-like MFS transporter